MSAERVNVLVIGTGMYVCGRGTEGAGTILPAVMQAGRAGRVGRVLVASGRAGSFEAFDVKAKALARTLGTDFRYEPYPSPSGDTTWRDALRELPDPGAVIVVSPDDLHVEMAAAAVEQGRHVLVVKPLAPTLAEARALAEAAEAACVHGVVELHKRWDVANLTLRDAVRQETIGAPLFFHVEYSQRRTIPTRAFAAWVARTNVFQYLGVHYVDVIHFVTGARPRRLVATGQRHHLVREGVAARDAIQTLVEWSGGFASTLLTSWIDPERSSAMSQQSIRVVGTGGRLESDQTARGLRLVTDAGVEEINPYFCQPTGATGPGPVTYQGYGIESVTQFIEDVGEIAAGRTSPAALAALRPTFRSALASTAVVEGVHLSLAADGAWVEFADDLTPRVSWRGIGGDA